MFSPWSNGDFVGEGSDTASTQWGSMVDSPAKRVKSSSILPQASIASSGHWAFGDEDIVLAQRISQIPFCRPFWWRDGRGCH